MESGCAAQEIEDESELKLSKVIGLVQESPALFLFALACIWVVFIELFRKGFPMDYTFKVEIIREGEDSETIHRAVSATSFDEALKKLRNEIRKRRPLDKYYPLVRVLWFEINKVI
jgi:hypothetical protein